MDRVRGDVYQIHNLGKEHLWMPLLILRMRSVLNVQETIDIQQLGSSSFV